MNLNNAMLARRTLVTLLRQPEKWPENYTFDWPDPSERWYNGQVYGCAQVLARLTGIVKCNSEFDFTNSQSHRCFFNGRADIPEKVADENEQTIPIHEMLL